MRFIYTKTFLFFGATVILGAVLVLLNSKGYLSPLDRLLVEVPRPVIYASSRIARPVKNFFSTAYSLRSIVRENTALEAKVNHLQQQVVLLDQYRLENEVLKKELGFVKQSQFSLVTCSILSNDPQGLNDVFVLSCGQDAGVKEGQAVVSEGYLVGRIIFTTKDSSTAQLITNSQSSLDAKVSKTGAEGVVRGSFGSGLYLDLISQTAEINQGDIIVTAGISSLIPKNILIGEAGDLISGPNDLFKKRSVVSPIKFHDLDFVFVVRE